jgi:hypothetical protein
MVSGFLPFNIEIFEGLELWSVVFSHSFKNHKIEWETTTDHNSNPSKITILNGRKPLTITLTLQKSQY